MTPQSQTPGPTEDEFKTFVEGLLQVDPAGLSGKHRTEHEMVEFGYIKDKNQVSLRGELGSTTNQPVYTLPHGHRPLSDTYFVAESDTGPVNVTVMAEGSIVIDAETRWTNLDGIAFLVDR